MKRLQHGGWVQASARVAMALVALCVVAEPVAAQESERPTIQNRFATKKSSVYGHVTGTTHIRNDFYDSFGVGLDLGYYFTESVGFEVRGLLLETRLSAPAADIKENTGLTPDARPQSLIATAGPRWSIGYGKLLAFDSFVVHFDPQLVLEGGIAVAERRILPTMTTAFSALMHFKWGVQVKLDLGMSFQMEKRDRGWVPSFGFMPVLGVGWNYGGGGG